MKQEEFVKSLGTVYQIGGGTPPDAADVVRQRAGGGVGGASGVRRHKLVSETDPQAPPNGFFDGTFEVLWAHPNDSGPYSLYVTDYTSNPSIHAVQAEWCPTSLGDKILKIEMWGEQGVEFAKECQRGEFYRFNNCRVKVSSGGYVEGTMSEVKKIRRLREDVDTRDPHFLALLE